MIWLTNELAMTADECGYIVGKPRARRGRGVVMDNPRYYSTIGKAVHGALQAALRQGVKEESITTLREFIDRQAELEENFRRLLSPLE